MQTVAANLVAVAVALHSVLGCCWHHVCEIEAAAAETCSETESAHSCRHFHSHDHSADDVDEESSSDEHQPAEPCEHSCGERCVIGTVDRVQFDLDDAEFSTALPRDVLTVSAASGLKTTVVAARDATTYPPPQRLYLLHHLFLI